MTPPPLPCTPSPAGGSAMALIATVAAGSCSSLPIPAVVTVAVPAPPSGIQSRTAYFPKSPKTGPPSLSTVTPKSSTSSATHAPEQSLQSRPTSTEGSIQPAPHPIQSTSAVFVSNDIRLCPPGTIRLLQCESIVASALSSGGVMPNLPL